MQRDTLAYCVGAVVFLLEEVGEGCLARRQPKFGSAPESCLLRAACRRQPVPDECAAQRTVREPQCAAKRTWL
jgi:hypothetical protein